MREDHDVEGALLDKSQQAKKLQKESFTRQRSENNYNKGKGEKKSYPPFQHWKHCKKFVDRPKDRKVIGVK